MADAGYERLPPEVLKECNSEDPIERFEAFEQLWAHVFGQGSPSSDAPAVIEVLIDWIHSGHPDWSDILEGVCGCALNVADGPTYPQSENSLRIEVLKTILRRYQVFEAALGRPCVTSQGHCRSHASSAQLLALAIPERSTWLAGQVIQIIRADASQHLTLWDTVLRLDAFDSLSDEDLHLCTQQTGFEELDRAALIQLAARGDKVGIDRLLRAAVSLNPFPPPTVGEAMELSRRPGRVPFELLSAMYGRAHDPRAIHDLACGIIRKAANDQREGWNTVSERRDAGRLTIRHPGVEATRPLNLTELSAWKDDLLRKTRLSVVDTDLWSLFGL